MQLSLVHALLPLPQRGPDDVQSPPEPLCHTLAMVAVSSSEVSVVTDPLEDICKVNIQRAEGEGLQA